MGMASVGTAVGQTRAMPNTTSPGTWRSGAMHVELLEQATTAERIGSEAPSRSRHRPQPGPIPRTFGRRLGTAVRLLLPGGIWISGQLITLGMVAWIASADHRHLRDVLTSWDATIFGRIADQGYTWTTSATATASPAFFPAVPTLMRAVHRVTGIPTELAGSVISVVASVIFAYGLAKLATLLRAGDRRTGLMLVGLASVCPLSIVFMMAYTEALFCAFAVWTLVLVMKQKWLAAGFLSFCAGLVRPTGPALAAAVVVAVVVAFVRHRGSVGAAVGAAVAPLGTVGYIVLVAVKVGSPGAYFAAQQNGWGTKFDGGISTFNYLRTTLTTAPAVLDVAVVVVVGASVVLLALLVRLRPGWPIILYTVLAMVTDIGSAGVMNSKVRLMIPAFGLLIPVAIWVRRQRPAVAVLTLTVITLAGTWYSAYGLVIYAHAI